MHEIRKVALVVGAGRGIGCACARVLESAGYFVHRVSRSTGDSGSSSFRGLLLCDVATEAGRIELENYVQKLDRLDLVVHAFGGTLGTTSTSSIEEWQLVFDANFFAVVELDRFLRVKMSMQDKGGSIVYVSSSAAEHGGASVPYSCAKAALNRYIVSEGRIWIKKKVAMIGLMPAAVSGDDNVWSRRKKEDPCAYARVSDSQGLGRFQSTEEVAEAVRYLGGEPGKIFSGCVVPADSKIG